MSDRFTLMVTDAYGEEHAIPMDELNVEITQRDEEEIHHTIIEMSDGVLDDRGIVTVEIKNFKGRELDSYPIEDGLEVVLFDK